ncbi:hypothetical protein ABID76_006341 [Burkholderia ambifaria]
MKAFRHEKVRKAVGPVASERAKAFRAAPGRVRERRPPGAARIDLRGKRQCVEILAAKTAHAELVPGGGDRPHGAAMRLRDAARHEPARRYAEFVERGE